MIALAADQGGLVTEGQLARFQGAAGEARLGLRAMEKCGEVEQVRPGVWVHAATGRMPMADVVLEAQARWLSLAPRLLLRERTPRTQRDAVVSVIGGGAAWLHWGFGPTVWAPALCVPSVDPAVTADELVDIVVDPIDPVDVVWVNQYPYLRPEATLARAYEAIGDLDAVAGALRDALRPPDSLSGELLAYHLRVIAERSGWTDDGWNGERIYRRLLGLAGGWPARPNRDWWPSAAHVERVRREHPSWPADGALLDWWHDYRDDTP